MTLVKEIQQWYLGFADNILNYYINKNILLKWISCCLIFYLFFASLLLAVSLVKYKLGESEFHLDQILYPELPKQAVCST